MDNSLIAGVDEVGKGCLFGPVFAGAVILSKANELKLLSQGLRDSKKLNCRQRNRLVPLIKENSIAWSLGQASAREIDSVGIRMATEKAMLRALEKFLSPPELILVDGKLPIRLWKGKQKTQVRGESHFASIAAASVLAKEARDELIKRLACKFSLFGLENNKGYGTKIHRANLIKEGATKLHRKSFLSKLKID
ncbi:ribonuclease HII [Prochlorococcus marinus]|uniref:Ribonuclease HII n=1 Tax=Prochlorococcus marinus XMU1408 TaxID=2213228 RepID=A0A318R847_PROMR|nr:ribonuclease HII [Prochlorococcus marinus]MBW3042718.1 ribonuclease HII [Prochlorococcus marinus str. XMU1408]PYE01458.1 ribonuclease HII [Prochlorococcus marinus XMU1408]